MVTTGLSKHRFRLAVSVLLTLAVAQACNGGTTAGTTTTGGTTGGATGSTTGSSGGDLDRYSVSATVTGLQGTGLVLRLNDSVDIAVPSNGQVTFDATFATGTAYSVVVKTQPSSPAQSCSVSGGNGTIGTASVTSIVIDCASDQFTIGGSVSGLATGPGPQTVRLQLEDGDALDISSNTTFAFATTRPEGASYAVTVVSSPVGQTCNIAGGAGTILSPGNVTSISVNCETSTYLVSGTVTGLEGTGLILQLNGGNDLAVNTSSFAFALPLDHGSAYEVRVRPSPLAQPVSPWQTCTITNASGPSITSDVSNVVVACVTNIYELRGRVLGLMPESSDDDLGLVLRVNGTELVPFTNAPNADFGFSSDPILTSGTDYLVEVFSQPQLPEPQFCAIVNPTGPVTDSAPSITVQCEPTFELSFAFYGTLGLDETLTVGLVTGETVVVDGVSPTVFSRRFIQDENFAISIVSPVPGQQCDVIGGSGTFATSDIGSVVVTCSVGAPTNFFVGGTVSGLIGSGLALQIYDPSPGPLYADLTQTIGGNGTYALNRAIPDGGAYTVVVDNAPTYPWQTCSITNDSGTITAANVANVDVSCVTNLYNVALDVSGLVGGGLRITLEASPDQVLDIGSNGTTTFGDQVLSGSMYEAVVTNQPTSPWQTCEVADARGMVLGGDITLSVVCTTNTYTLGGSVTGLVGDLSLDLNGELEQIEGGSGVPLTYTFDTALESLTNYTLTVASAPATQRCVASRSTGQVTDGNITDLNVTCADSFGITTSVSGHTGDVTAELYLDGNSTGSEVIGSGATTHTFGTRAIAGESYEVVVTNSPAGQRCRVTNGTGVVSAAVGNVSITCLTAYELSVVAPGFTAGTDLQVYLAQDDAFVSLPANGAATAFSGRLVAGDPYTVTVTTQPTLPWQTCSVVGGGTGVMPAEPLTLTITCVLNQYSVALDLTGGQSQSLEFELNGSVPLTVSTDSVVAFTGLYDSGSAYSIAQVGFGSVGQERLCTVTSASGVIAGNNLTLSTSCVAAYPVSVSVTGLAGELQLSNGAQQLTISGDGTFPFLVPLLDGASYNVLVAAHPAGQSCFVEAGAGTINGASPAPIVVNCVAGYRLAGAVVRGVSNENVTLTLQVNAQPSPALPLTTDGRFLLAAELAANDTFALSAATASGDCMIRSNTVANGVDVYQLTGSIPGVSPGPIADIQISCPLRVAAAVSAATAIPDGVGGSCTTATPGSLNIEVAVAQTFALQGVGVSMGLVHTWPGDLSASITPPNAASASILNRPGTGNCGASNDIAGSYTFDDLRTADFNVATTPANGSFFPFSSPTNVAASERSNFNSTYAGLSAVGNWNVQVRDHVQDDFGSVNNVVLILWPQYLP